METSTMIYLLLGLTVAVIGPYLYYYIKEKKEIDKMASGQSIPSDIKPLQLQAYERLVLLSERIALPNVISRTNQPGLSKSEMANLLTQTIKGEFEHNLSQQIYVSEVAWEAVRNLKDQNIMVIHQVNGFLPVEASGQDLNKAILEVLNKSEINLSALVQDAISYEAKKIF
jgi:hypothetical protein